MDAVLTDSDEFDMDDEAVALIVMNGVLLGFGMPTAPGAPRLHRVRSANKSRDFTEAEKRFTRYYFGESPVYDDNDFKRRLHMPFSMF